MNDIDKDGDPFEIISGSYFNKFEGWNNIAHKDKALKNIYDNILFKKITAVPADVIFADATAFHRGNIPIKVD